MTTHDRDWFPCPRSPYQFHALTIPRTKAPRSSS